MKRKNMTDVEYRAMRDAILTSCSIEECPRPPVPKFTENQNFVFISYSHKDYKAVYTDLLAFYQSGVRFWYDGELPFGQPWDKEVETMLAKPECAGVIFYMSENLLLSRSAGKEIQYVLGETTGNRKNFFAVNLAGVSPSHLIGQIFRSHSDEELTMLSFYERLSDLVNAFPNKNMYPGKNLPTVSGISKKPCNRSKISSAFGMAIFSKMKAK